MPNVVEFGSDNYFRWGRKKIKSKRDNKIMIAVSGIQADLRGKFNRGTLHAKAVLT
jgi:hypothetical protein